ncbi:MAG: sterol desaturase family protein [Saprospiraceae bacterium]|nr:sterol desaturase family protein [Candidatus Vicinibacter proximus]MBL7824063.1 sterol desaturase family protein [Saprospiraceae bacterium]MCC6842155.1 sterol desaturase family protein [Saprospiraceae bacterium]HRG32849.1 sterol desaturase family protein [Saprospiraceae bacterium]
MATWVINTGLVFLAFIGMEFMAWFTHKYVMHGFLWTWHEDHHKPHQLKEGFWEKNDRFFLVFAVPSFLCYLFGSLYPDLRWLLFIGIGISIYGICYFLVHDVYIHRRFEWFKPLDNTYSKAVLKAHGAHHAKQTKEDGESFGMLFVNPKYFRKKKAI